MPTSVFQTMAQDATLKAVLDKLGPPAQYEVDSVSVGAASAGTVTLSFVWDNITWTTGSIAFNASAASVASAVQSAIGPGGQLLPANVVVGSGGPLATGAVTLTFQNELVGPVTGQAITPSGLTGGTAAFTRTITGLFGGITDALATTAGNNASGPFMVVGGVDFNGKARPVTLDGGGNIYIDGPFQGTYGSNVPGASVAVGFKDVNGKLNSPAIDAAGALTLQSSGTTGSAAPSKTLLVGGQDSGSLLRPLSIDANGNIGLQPAGAPAATAPSKAVQVAGTDSGGLLRALSVTTAGVVATQDAGAVPEAPLSINKTAFVLNQSGAPPAAVTINQTSTLLLPDSTGVNAINGIRGQAEITNVGNVDCWVSPSLATQVGVVWPIRPGGSLVLTYSGPLSAIQNGTASGSTIGSPVGALSVIEWA
jgi:hypothetical protein